MTRSDMVEDGSVEESPSEAGELATGRCSEDEPDDAELVHSAGGRCSDDEPLSALKPEGAEQPQGDPPQLEESQSHEVSQVDPKSLKPNKRFLDLYERFGFSSPEDERSGDEPLSAPKPEGAKQPQGERPQASQQLEESQRHEVSLSSREEFLHQFEGHIALYGVRFVPPEGAEQPQGERPLDELGDSQLHESQGHEVRQVDPEASQQRELEDELKAMLESTPELDGDESQGHEESQLDTEPSMPNETFRAQYTRLSHREPEPRCL